MPSLPAPCDSLSVWTFQTPLGWMAIAGRQRTLHALVFGCASERGAREAIGRHATGPLTFENWHPALAARLMEFAAGAPDDFCDVPVSLEHAAGFARRVLERCRRIGPGQTLSYAQLAAVVGRPGAARAVGNVMAGNRCPLVVPCHRVIRADGTIGHFSSPQGPRMKARLLALEGRAHGAQSLRPARGSRVRV